MNKPKAGARFVALCLFLVAWPLLVSQYGRLLPPDPVSVRAATMMESAMAAVCSARLDAGIPIDPITDPFGTGLIGEAYSGLTSTAGSLPAKRSAASPDAAALVVRLLREAGAKPGQRVAINASGSFPGFAIAAVSASAAMSLDAEVILSIGSSSWGANIDSFTVLDMMAAAIDGEAFPPEYASCIAAVTPGGSDDRGLDLDPNALERALSRAEAKGITVRRPESLESSVSIRMDAYRSRGEPDMLLTIGGNYASSGADPELARMSGIVDPNEVARSGGAGLMQEFTAAGKPVIQLLNVKDLYARYGLAFDPKIRRPIGTARVYHLIKPPAVLTIAPLIAALSLFVFFTKKRSKAE